MSFVVFNTLTRAKEPFEPLEPGLVRMYNCGPTVYNRQHLGNFRSFLFADTLRRWLEYLGYEVRQVMNITDVGHLTQDDGDGGEDKIQAQARREGRDPWEISRRYTEQFFADLEALGFKQAMIYPRATEHVDEMLEIIDGLVEHGYAYVVDGNVYFDVTSFEGYGQLSGNRLEDLLAGARIEVRSDKRHPADFALWKSDPNHLMKWDTRYGPDGFPGWHIECSAMARKHLGDQIDIHTGGEDNVFPHHECEIAQSESFTGKPFARYWMHARFLQIDGGKMSKSLGNVYTLDDVRDHVRDAARGMRALRYALVRGHYRQPLNFTWDFLAEAESALDGLEELVARLRTIAGGQGADPDAQAGAEVLAEARQLFEDAMNDDLNTPQALSALFDLRSHVVNRRPMGAETASAALAFLERANNVLPVLDLSQDLLDEDVDRLIRERGEARANKDFARADQIRDQLLARDIVLLDTPDGVVWKRG